MKAERKWRWKTQFKKGELKKLKKYGKKECERKSKTKVKVKGKLEINEESQRNSIHN